MNGFNPSRTRLAEIPRKHLCIFRPVRFLIAALILSLSGNALAGISVGLVIQNDTDINGRISVVNGSKVRVSYVILEDTDKDLHKKDLIQLVRVDDDSVVGSVERGKKKAGTVSIKVKNSEDEQLYVHYVRKGSRTLIARYSHPSDPDYIPLFSIAGANAEDLTIRLNAIENDGILSRLFAGDGSAEDLTVSSNTNWASSPPSNTNFRNFSNDADQTLTVPAGTTITCTGSFINNGILRVNQGASSEGSGWIAANPQSSGPRGSAHPGDAISMATLGHFDNDSISDPVTLYAGEGGNGIPQSTARLSFMQFRMGGGAGAAPDTAPASGGGLVRIFCRDRITNLGLIEAIGNDGISAGGGGGGGIVILASIEEADNLAGNIDVSGGDGSGGGSNFGSSGGGGGGIVILMSPVAPGLGTVDASGGSGGVGGTTQNKKGRLGGSGGGASGGFGGGGGGVSNTGANLSGSNGGSGYTITITGNPLYLPR